MLSPFHKFGAKEVSAKKLVTPKARDLAVFLQRPNLPFVRYIRCEKIERLEAVVFEVDVELGQKKLHDIRDIEPIGVVFDPNDVVAPEVLVLREDFPVLPHQNTRSVAPPRWLCLDEEPYSEQKLRWSPLSFVERIREWLRLSAVGKLHEEDQPLEQLLGSTEGTIILPHDFRKRFDINNPTASSLSLCSDSWDRPVLRVDANDNGRATTSKPRVIPAVFVTQAVEHGVIDAQPSNLYALHEFCLKAKFDLMEEMGARLRDWIVQKKRNEIHGDRLALIIIFPKRRHTTGPIETLDTWVFLLGSDISQVAIALGVEEKRNGITAPTINIGEKKNIVNKALVEKLGILPLRPVYTLNAANAAFFNGFSLASDKLIAAVGVGALGSQIFNNMLRSGFGKWTLIDKDILLPHNCARHALYGNFVGLNKTDSLAFLANNTLDGSSTAAISVDIFNPGDKAKDLTNALDKADVILDFSASVSAARHLGIDVPSKARRASVFLNPSGSDSVILIEDSKRKYPLLWLEMEYYRLIANETSLSKHLDADVATIRYARSCGDVSSRINHNLVALHAAVGSQVLRTSLEQDAASIAIFRANPENFTVQKLAFPPVRFKSKKVSGWTVHVSESALNKAHHLRKFKSPNETGGVLIGYFDRPHHSIYVVDVLPAPQDSSERPILFIRGVRGLQKEVARIKTTTMSNLEYVGEWHSHPPKCSPEMSRIDKRELKTLSEEMAAANLPAVMLIVADKNYYKFFIR